MPKISVICAAALVMGSLATAPTSYAAQTTLDTTVYLQPQIPKTQMLDCAGTTGRMGFGPGWFWRDGWRGWGCYPC